MSSRSKKSIIEPRPEVLVKLVTEKRNKEALTLLQQFEKLPANIAAVAAIAYAVGQTREAGNATTRAFKRLKKVEETVVRSSRRMVEYSTRLDSAIRATSDQLCRMADNLTVEAERLEDNVIR